MSTLLFKNIGTLLSGDMERPIIKADSVLVRDGVIETIGNTDVAEVEVDKVVDLQGMTLAPGLIDGHVHPVLGDFTPRQKMSDFIDSSLHGGVTTMISAGEAHTPGRPKDPSGVKALAILAHKCSANQRPAGVKLHGGALILEKGLTESDFAEMAREGVWLVGEIGLGSVKDPQEAAQMVQWAHSHGMKVMMHTGGTSIPGSSVVTADDVISVGPDVASHVNGGPTAPPLAEIEKMAVQGKMAMEIVHCGNPKAADFAARLLNERGELHRITIGNDAPSGTGVIPLGILRVIAQLTSLSAIPAGQAVAMATGNTARLYGLNTGIIEPGREADFVILDAPMGSVGEDTIGALEAGDIPAVSMVVIDGKILVQPSRNTPPAKRKPVIIAG
ncbi:MAG: amidohydrolase family protein [Dethiobacter sp.]|jgi:enamidase|nr:amidohydrolase family protein [Dethiobacter sp.]